MSAGRAASTTRSIRSASLGVVELRGSALAARPLRLEQHGLEALDFAARLQFGVQGERPVEEFECLLFAGAGWLPEADEEGRIGHRSLTSDCRVAARAPAAGCRSRATR